jgi:hypothetical protein
MGGSMGVIEDVLKALERIPIWKRLREIPDEVDDLKRRIAELEVKLGGKWPPDVCQFCGARAARMIWSDAADSKGIARQDWHCSACDKTEIRSVKPR